MIFSTRCVSALSVLVWVIASVATTPATASDLTYKETPLGTPEQQFVLKHVNEGFVCEAAPNKLGRWCTSQSATYEGLKAHTLAQFLHDQLQVVSIFFAIASDDPADANGTRTDAIVSVSMESRYGAPTETVWPTAGATGAKVWRKTWRRPDGSYAVYMRIVRQNGAAGGTTRALFLNAKDAVRLYEEERLKRQ